MYKDSRNALFCNAHAILLRRTLPGTYKSEVANRDLVAALLYHLWSR